MNIMIKLWRLQISSTLFLKAMGTTFYNSFSITWNYQNIISFYFGRDYFVPFRKERIFISYKIWKFFRIKIFK